MNVVEVDHALGRHAVGMRSQLEFRNEPSLAPGQGSHDNRPYPIGDRITCEDKNGPVATWCLCEPDFTPFH